MPSPRPDRVLLLSMHTSPVDQPGSGDAGGMNVYVWHLAHALAQAGWRVDAATLNRRPEHTEGVRAEEIAPGIRLLSVAVPGAAAAPKAELPRFTADFGAALARFYARASQDDDAAAPRVLHAHYWLSAAAGVVVSEALNVPLVLTLHTSAAAKNLRAGPDEPREPAEREHAERDLVSRVCCTVVNTPVEGEQLVALCGADPAKVRVIPPGVDPAVFHPPGDGPQDRGQHPAPFTVLCAGRMQPLKGQQVLVRALGILRREHPEVPVRLVLAGTGSPEFLEHLRELARVEGVAGDVVFRGSLPRPELARLMGAVDAVAVASSSETFGLVAVEAQACGTPVLATDVDGLRYAVRDGRTGVLVPGRDPAVWARELLRAAREPQRWRAMSQAAVRRARELTWDDVAAQHAAAYRACAPARPTA
ncbi:glycosyltransferase [Kocuria tytonicola]|uniref:D-inositol 3-phosphate glycosyltransferase n=2 Tax=Kocuria tytonicola TaxID=2055946 RepID=A0A3L9L626_9MICC|nr:glycosyltransferase [Kocuria tytonicola]